MMHDESFQLIESAPHDHPILVRRGPAYARAYWTGAMWAYDVPPKDFVEQLDFDPTHWRELKSA